MSLLDDVRRTLTDAAGTAFEKGQQAADVVRLQAQQKKLQLERARRLHELGARTYDWFKSGTMIVTGPVPADVVEVCRALQSVQTQMDETARALEEAQKPDPATSPPDPDPTFSASSTPSVPPPGTTVTPPPDPYGTTYLPRDPNGPSDP